MNQITPADEAVLAVVGELQNTDLRDKPDHQWLLRSLKSMCGRDAIKNASEGKLKEIKSYLAALWDSRGLSLCQCTLEEFIDKELESRHGKI